MITLPCHGGITGSNPVRVVTLNRFNPVVVGARGLCARGVMAAALGLGPSGEIRGGSTPLVRTDPERLPWGAQGAEETGMGLRGEDGPKPAPGLPGGL